jgi:hypothetical protein
VATLEDEIEKKKLHNFESLVSAIKREWKALPQELAIKLVHSMQNRISEVVENEGDFILR